MHVTIVVRELARKEKLFDCESLYRASVQGAEERFWVESASIDTAVGQLVWNLHLNLNQELIPNKSIPLALTSHIRMGEMIREEASRFGINLLEITKEEPRQVELESHLVST